ncbi:MAG: acyltransferase family protein [Deltaproteobacteria bacterium]|nr:acyltransferase family protein [Deltaproteobacteria bacterium]
MGAPRRAAPSRKPRTPRSRLGQNVALAPLDPPPPAPVVRAAPSPPFPRRGGAVGRVALELAQRLRAAIDSEFGRQYERILTELGPGDFDPFGFDLGYARYAVHFAAALYRRWFRCKVRGLENIPPGRALLVSNHSGQIPIDGMMIATALILDHEPPRLVRSMIEKWAATLPVVSTFFARCGQVVGIPENCRILLEREELILVFPEGARGISKTIDRAYQLEEFGSGFVRLALENRAPIVPVAVVGAEEQYPSVLNLRALADVIGAPAVPVSPLVLLGPLGLLPLPTRYHIAFGRPIVLGGEGDEDDEQVAEHVRVVRAAIQDLLRRTLDERKSIFG